LKEKTDMNTDTNIPESINAALFISKYLINNHIILTHSQRTRVMAGIIIIRLKNPELYESLCKKEDLFLSDNLIKLIKMDFSDASFVKLFLFLNDNRVTPEEKHTVIKTIIEYSESLK
jgi:hypothetical protein